MLLTNHTLTGLALSQAIDSPVLLAPVALSSHLIIDSLPHFGHDKQLRYGSRAWMTVAAIDNVAALSIFICALIARPEQWPKIVIGVFFACLPDLIFLLELLFNRRQHFKNAFSRFHSRIQGSHTYRGMVVEGAWGALMGFFILRG